MLSPEWMVLSFRPLLLLAALVTQSMTVSSAQADLYLELRTLQDLSSTYFQNKRYFSRELYELNRRAFLEHYQAFMQEVRSEFSAARPLAGELDPRSRFLVDVESLQWSLLSTRTLVDVGPQASLEHPLSFEEVFSSFPWNKDQLTTFLEKYAIQKNLGRGVKLATHVTKPSEAILVVKFVERWAGVLGPDYVGEEVNEFASHFAKVNTDMPSRFALILDAIMNTTTRPAEWIWKYLLEGDQTYYSHTYSECVQTILNRTYHWPL
jgi:hypothetical protein